MKNLYPGDYRTANSNDTSASRYKTITNGQIIDEVVDASNSSFLSELIYIDLYLD